MSKDLNNLTMIGRATADCKIKTVGTLTIGEFSIATNDIKKTASGYADEVSFFNCTIFGKLAENVGKYITKGKQIAIEGKLKQERWTQDGNNRSTVKIIVNNVQLLGSVTKAVDENFEEHTDEQFNDGAEF